MPLSFHDWLGKKFNHKMAKEKMRSTEFERLRSGKPHNLSQEEVDKMLSSSGKYSLLSKEQLMEEISYRIDSWILDVSGRRDFQHAFNVKLHRNLKTEKLIWEKLTAEEQKKHKYEVTKTILQEKQEEFLSKERTSAMISKDLYWRYREALKDRLQEFDVWLADHLTKFKETIDGFRLRAEKMSKAMVKDAASKAAVAGLNNIEKQLKEVWFVGWS
jgi:hypothetical protein